jgi:DNA mismatch repair ATPase MutS
MGFCPKVPHERILKLLEFPLTEFIAAIKTLNPNELLPEYPVIEKEIKDILKNQPDKPEIIDNIKRENPPKLDLTNDDNKIEIIKWYVNKILEIRKQLLPYVKKYEEYYKKSIDIIVQIYEVVKRKIDESMLYKDMFTSP